MVNVSSEPLEGLPTSVFIYGRGDVSVRPWKQARELAFDYMKSANLPYIPIKRYVRVDQARAARIAAAYDSMRHEPSNSIVQRRYSFAIAETVAQFAFIKQTGLKLRLIRDVNPYLLTPRLALLDIVENNCLAVLPTDQKFGSIENKSRLEKNLMRDTLTGEYVDGVQLCANDVFRVVHDYFGHLKEGVGFLADGEENAWRSHASMYSEEALGPITSESRAQNSWVHFGDHGRAAANRAAQLIGQSRLEDPDGDLAFVEFADQKNGVLPDWVCHEGRAD